eukprot:4525254-Pleurochrysis_carterae.AAC.1
MGRKVPDAERAPSVSVESSESSKAVLQWQGRAAEEHKVRCCCGSRGDREQRLSTVAKPTCHRDGCSSRAWPVVVSTLCGRKVTQAAEGGGRMRGRCASTKSAGLFCATSKKRREMYLHVVATSLCSGRAAASTAGNDGKTNGCLQDKLGGQVGRRAHVQASSFGGSRTGRPKALW